MSDTVIQVENLGKKYIIGHQQQERYTSLRDVIASSAKGLLKTCQNPKSKIQNSKEEFWALKDVSFEIKQGDRVGIIGRNGAGKSTLLKILSRITEPTKGRIQIQGRVASLLEVGTGFHPELTGRENIFLNGAILGMSKVEIKRKFDEIVAFAEVEKFLDTPVKRYSSGMYVRLAFAVAAHLEPEILVVDEVLAVGDAAFQKKCLGKMEDVGKEGKTVIFVSHQMDMIKALCDRAILLNQGNVLSIGTPGKVITDYLDNYQGENLSQFEIEEDTKLPMQIIRGRVLDINSSIRDTFDVFEQIILEFEYVIHDPKLGLMVNLKLKRYGTTIFCSFDTDTNQQLINPRKKNSYVTRVKLPCPLLKSGKYSVSPGIGIANKGQIQHLEDILVFNVELHSKPSSLLSYSEKRPGLIAVPLNWNTKIKY